MRFGVTGVIMMIVDDSAAIVLAMLTVEITMVKMMMAVLFDHSWRLMLVC